MEQIDQSFVDQQLKTRITSGNKYTFGNILIYAGSPGKWGASILASLAALRAGTGLVTSLMDKSKADLFLTSCPEVMHLYEFDLPVLEKFDAIGFGSGLGKTGEVKANVYALLQYYPKPMVLDADALNIISENEPLKSYLKPYHVLTPHFGEASRLFGTKVTDENAIELGLNFVKKYPCTLVLKGEHSKIISYEGQVFENTSGNDALATAGSGDVLTGIITSFLGKGYEPTIAACLGVYVHGKLADDCIKKQSKSSLIASDLIEKLKSYEL